jgi:DNA-binding HxlR family transcriptional regulator
VLLEGPLPFTLLKAALPSISANILTKRLRVLIEAEVIERSSPKVGGATRLYALTGWGRELAPIHAALTSWIDGCVGR